MKERKMNGRLKKLNDNARKKAGSACSRMSAEFVHSTCAGNCFALDAAFVRSTCFQCSRLRISRFTGPFDSSMNTSTRAHSDIRTIHAENAEHALLLKSISSAQRCSLQRSMRANMRSAHCACFMIMCAKRQAVHVRA
jgi:hypothetical protein